MDIEVCHVSEEGRAPVTRGTKRGRKTNVQASAEIRPTKRRKTNNDGAPASKGVKSKLKSKVEVESEAEGSNDTEPESEDEEDQLGASQYLDTELPQEKRAVTPVTPSQLAVVEENPLGGTAQATSAASASVSVPARPPILVPPAPISVSVSVAIPAKRLPGRRSGCGKKRGQPAEESDDDYVPPKMVNSGSLKVQGTKKTRMQPSRHADGAS